MNIFFNGCSMVYGKDLVPQTIEQENDLTDETHIARLLEAWPGVLSRALRARSVNYARCGASMDCVVRTTYENINPEFTHALIGLTEPLRFEFFDPDVQDYSQVVLPRGSYKRMYPFSKRRFIEDTAWLSFTDYPAMVRYASNILALQMLFKNQGIKHYFVNSLHDYVTPCIDKLPWFANLFDQTSWDSGTSMFELCRSEGLPFGSTVHPLHEGHAFFAGHVARLVSEKWAI